MSGPHTPEEYERMNDELQHTKCVLILLTSTLVNRIKGGRKEMKEGEDGCVSVNMSILFNLILQLNVFLLS